MSTRPMHLSELAQKLRPDLHLVSVSSPDPLLASHNVVAEVDSTEQARKLVVELENHLDVDAEIGLVVMSSARDVERPPLVDPEGVTGSLARGILVGAAIGAAVGALIGAIVGYVFGGWTGAIAFALGGIGLVGAFGGIWGAFTRMGGTDAYRQTFVEPQVDDVTIVTFHSNDGSAAAAVRRRLQGESGVRLLDTSEIEHRADGA